MALYELNINSQYLKGNEEITVIMPDKPGNIEPRDFYKKDKKYKVLWLFHGECGDCSDWVRKTQIELYACENDLIVVMPSAMNSFYSSWPDYAVGYDFPGFFFKELMPMIYGWFPVSRKREDNYIAGISMGGEGAYRYAMKNPEKFKGVAILSWHPEKPDNSTQKVADKNSEECPLIYYSEDIFKGMENNAQKWQYWNEAIFEALVFFGISQKTT